MPSSFHLAAWKCHELELTQAPFPTADGEGTAEDGRAQRQEKSGPREVSHQLGTAQLQTSFIRREKLIISFPDFKQLLFGSLLIYNEAYS